MKRRSKFAVPWARVAAAGAALALCPAGALAAACADALVMATGHRNFTGAKRTGVLAAMNAALGAVAATAGIVSCGVVPAVLAGGALAWAVGSVGSGKPERKRETSRRSPQWMLEGEVIDAEFCDPDPVGCVTCRDCAELRSEALSARDPDDVWVYYGKRARRRL